MELLTVEIRDKGLFKALMTCIEKSYVPLMEFAKDCGKAIMPKNNEQLGFEIAKILACIAMNIPMDKIPANCDSLVNEFLRNTKNMSDFKMYKGTKIWQLAQQNIYALKGSVLMFLYVKKENIKFFTGGGVDEALGAAGDAGLTYKGGVKGAAEGRIGGIFDRVKSWFKGGGANENTGDFQDDALAKITNQLIDVLGLGVGDNGKDGSPVYYMWKYYPNQPYNMQARPDLKQPVKEPISVGYFKTEWKPIIEKESGFDFNTAQAFFLKYYDKIRLGYFKNQPEFWLFCQGEAKKAVMSGKKPVTAKSRKRKPFSAFFK